MARFKNIWIQKMFEIALHSETAKLNRKCEHRIKFQPFLFRLIMTFMMAMSPVAVIITRESGVAWKKFLLERFLGGLWNKDKQRTPVYPQGAYQPQATVRPSC